MASEPRSATSPGPAAAPFASWVLITCLTSGTSPLTSAGRSLRSRRLRDTPPRACCTPARTPPMALWVAGFLLFAPADSQGEQLKVCAKSLQSCLTFCDPMDCSPPGSSPWDSPGKNTGVGCRALLQGIFPAQGSNPLLLHLLNWQVGSSAT